MKNLEVLYEDDNCLALYKPAGLLSVPDRYDPLITNMKHVLQAGDANLLIVHRLDKDTSGVILVAKHTEAQTHLTSQFENRTIKKEYEAIVHGIPTETEGLIDQPLVANEDIKGTMIIHKKGKSAQTNWELIKAYKYHAHLRLKPITGRTHQIRVHLAHIGHAILSDPIYGDGKALFLSSFKHKYKPNRKGAERPLLSRTALHAAKITFKSMDGKLVTVECEPPKDMRASLNQLGKNL